MFKKILVPIDDSKAANLALAKAIKLCQNYKAKLRIVHAIDYISQSTGIEGVDPETFREELKKSAQTMLLKAQKKAAKQNIKAQIELIESYKLADRIDQLILKSVKNWHPSLVVVGMHKKEGLSKLLFGSHSEKIIDAISAPILLIKHNPPAK
ncbi:universal stress protein [Candidatus Berkiella aquae]|uniref:Universal stress protein n=1 Tax=Candidatus Berkiella aquae TaxID=295108 RepID=A0A0Q9YYY1_9GAMM|nr:universal stress protein [Candidatus Berkiella aquae]MCS5710387.1 universal stress protein [Candidatus Berkiella aquae]